MNKDSIKGKIKQGVGAAKEQVGKAVDSPTLRDEGRVDQAEGKIQASYGKAKDKADAAVKRAFH